MAAPDNIPAGVIVTTHPGYAYSDENGDHFIEDWYSYADQRGIEVLYSPPILSSGDENGYGGGEIVLAGRWIFSDGSPYKSPQQAAFDAQWGGTNNPTDAGFQSAFFSILSQHLAIAGIPFAQAQVRQAVQGASWYGRLGSGSNPYNAAWEVMQILGSDTTSFNGGEADTWRQWAENRSPEGRARSQPHGGLFGEGGFLGLDNLGSFVLTVLSAMAAASFAAHRPA